MSTTIAPRAAAVHPTRLLRLALLADAVASGTLGLVVLGAGSALAGPLGLPAGLLQVAGAVCLAWALLVAWLGRRESLPGWAVWSVIGLNLCWVADSLLLLASGWVAPTALGTAFVIAQAAAVLGFAAAQWLGLRRAAG